MTQAFIRNIDTLERGNFTDELLIIAHNIEEALLLSGAIPGETYTQLDLFKLAEPYMLRLLNETKNMGFTDNFAKEMYPKRGHD